MGALQASFARARLLPADSVKQGFLLQSSTIGVHSLRKKPCFSRQRTKSIAREVKESALWTQSNPSSQGAGKSELHEKRQPGSWNEPGLNFEWRCRD